MSGTTNKPFLEGMAANPGAYLRSNLFNSQPDGALATGRVQVNLRIEEQLINVEQPPAVRGIYSKLFTNQFYAFWCRNTRGQSVSVVLNDTADYFFTPALTGCILEISGLTITHHDGELATFPPASLAAVAQAGPANTNGRRQWECPAGFGCCNVIGRRTGAGAWEFWQQTYTPAQSRVPLPAAQVTRI